MIVLPSCNGTARRRSTTISRKGAKATNVFHYASDSDISQATQDLSSCNTRRFSAVLVPAPGGEDVHRASPVQSTPFEQDMSGLRPIATVPPAEPCPYRRRKKKVTKRRKTIYPGQGKSSTVSAQTHRGASRARTRVTHINFKLQENPVQHTNDSVRLRNIRFNG